MHVLLVSTLTVTTYMVLRSLSCADQPAIISSSYRILEQCSHNVAEHITTSSMIPLTWLPLDSPWELGGRKASSTSSSTSQEAGLIAALSARYVLIKSDDIPAALEIDVGIQKPISVITIMPNWVAQHTISCEVVLVFLCADMTIIDLKSEQQSNDTEQSTGI